ncbi:MAG: hypothetical protein ABI823_20610 [Bryobacteraceae bacterium]
MSESRLQQILGTAIGPLNDIASGKEVHIDPTAACYLKMRVTVNLLVASCTLSGCSTAIADDQRIGIKQFDIEGCDAEFRLAGIRPTVTTAFADVAKDIADHCGAGAFRIASVHPERVDGRPVVRLVFAPR